MFPRHLLAEIVSLMKQGASHRPDAIYRNILADMAVFTFERLGIVWEPKRIGFVLNVDSV